MFIIRLIRENALLKFIIIMKKMRRGPQRKKKIKKINREKKKDKDIVYIKTIHKT